MKKSYFMAMSLIAGFAWLQAANSTAVKKEEAPTLGTVVVTDKKEPSLTVPSSEAASQQLNKVAGGTNLILGEDLKKGRVSNYKDALGFAPGVYIQSRFGSEESRLSIRGSGIQRTFHGRGIMLMQDGIPVNLADGGFDFQSLEPLSADYIEVYRGGNALRYGSSTLGGAINYVSKTGYTADPIQARFEAGSFGYIRAQVSSGLVEGPLDYYASVSHFTQEGYQEHSRQNSQKFLTNIGAKLNDRLENRIYFTWLQSDSELPGSLTKRELENDPQKSGGAGLASGSLRSFQRRDYELFRVADRLSWEFDQQKLEFSAFLSHKDLDHPITPFVGVIDQLTNDTGAELRYQNFSDFLGRKNQFTAGIQGQVGFTNNQTFNNVSGNRGTKIQDDHQRALNYTLYLENDHEMIKQWHLITGVQTQYAQRLLNDRFSSNGDQSDEQDYYGVSPKLGVRYDLDSDVNLFANYSRSFEPPSFGELSLLTGGAGLRNLNAQSADTIEFGSRGSKDRFSWDATFYQAWVHQELLSVQTSPGVFNTANAQETTHTGIELGFDVELLPLKAGTKETVSGHSLKFRQVYDWSLLRFDQDANFGNNPIAGMPEHMYRSELMYTHSCGFYAGPNMEWMITKYAIDHANTTFNDAYAIMGFKVGYTKDHWNAFVEAKNLTNEDYAPTTSVSATANSSTAAFNPGETIGVYAGVEFKY